MEVVSVKFKEDVLGRIDDSIVKHNFNSRTEFIREAVRDKLDALSRDDLIKEFLKLRGRAKKKTTFEEDMKIREDVSRELMEHLDKKLG
jgi:Arc/MetJ-type ribon-helix-helix transcriptional regulator